MRRSEPVVVAQRAMHRETRGWKLCLWKMLQSPEAGRPIAPTHACALRLLVTDSSRRSNSAAKRSASGTRGWQSSTRAVSHTTAPPNAWPSSTSKLLGDGRLPRLPRPSSSDPRPPPLGSRQSTRTLRGPRFGIPLSAASSIAVSAAPLTNPGQVGWPGVKIIVAEATARRIYRGALFLPRHGTGGSDRREERPPAVMAGLERRPVSTPPRCPSSA